MSHKFYQEQEELKHFGVLGMHWGQRKAGSSGGDSHFTRSLKQKYGPNAPAKLEATKKNVKENIKKAASFIENKRKDNLKKYIQWVDDAGAKGDQQMRQVINVVAQVSLAIVAYNVLKKYVP